MIEKFNFYDVYGYFLPGLSLLGLIFLPFGLVKHQWPATELSSALGAIVFAYILGHVIQTIAFRAFPSALLDSLGNRRYPSELFLDHKYPEFSEEFKGSLAKVVKDAFDIDLAIEKAPAKRDDPEFAPISRRRQDAFLLSRGVLIREKIAAYAEQSQGMYTLMRGLATSFVLGFAYFAGWSLSLFKGECLTALALVLIVLGLLSTLVVAACFLRSKPQVPIWVDRISLMGLMLTSLGVGYLFGLKTVESPLQARALGVVSIVTIIFALRCFGSYKSFARDFAKAVWRDFAGHRLVPPAAGHG